MDNSSLPTVCVIGAGLSGLASLKCMIDVGFKVTCIEKEDRVSGRWNPDCENPIPECTITNLPHFMSGYSDFPVPDDFPLYLPADVYCRYFELYVEKFNLLPHIKLGCKVIDAVPLTCFNKDPSRTSHGDHYWLIKYEMKDGRQIELEFDYLVVSSGFYQVPFIPDYISKALSTFKGNVTHCLSYKTWKEFEGKKVVVCGLGNSGGDIVSELSLHMPKTYLSTGRGSFVLGRVYDSGQIPIEMASHRIAQYVPDFISSYFRFYSVQRIANFVYKLDDLRLTPKSKALSSVIINDELCSRVVTGKVVVKTGIEKTVNRTVYFSDGSSIDDVDDIILCTGYKRIFPFLNENLLRLENNGKYIPLYKGIFSPNFHANIAFVGMFSVLGSVVLTAEMQARYAAEVFKGSIQLPSKSKMKNEIKRFENLLKSNYGDDVKEYNTIFNPWAYYDELADEIGCRPSLASLWFTDPLLAWKMCTTYSSMEYRLIGPNKWDGARDAILNKPRRMYSFMAGSRKVI